MTEISFTFETLLPALQKTIYENSTTDADPSKGYTEQNCRLVTYIFNCAQNQFGEADLLLLCRALVDKAQR